MAHKILEDPDLVHQEEKEIKTTQLRLMVTVEPAEQDLQEKTGNPALSLSHLWGDQLIKER